MNPNSPPVSERRTALRSGRPFSVPADSLPHLVWSAGADGEIDRWNEPWADYTGTPVADSTGWRWLDSVSACDRDQVRDLWTRGVAGKQYFEFRVQLWNLRTKTYRLQLVRAVPMRDLSDALVGWTGTLTD